MDVRLTGPTTDVALRPATDADRDFLAHVYGSTRADEMKLVDWNDEHKLAFLRMQFDAQDTYYREKFPDARFLVIEEDGIRIGRLYLARMGDEIRIIDIALLPECRGRGIGTQLLGNVIHDAHAQGLAIRLHVEPWNAARRLYERLGFRTISAGQVSELMELPAPSGQLKTAS